MICYIKNRWQSKSAQQLENEKILRSLSMQWGEVTCCLMSLASLNEEPIQLSSKNTVSMNHRGFLYYSTRAEIENFC